MGLSYFTGNTDGKRNLMGFWKNLQMSDHQCANDDAIIVENGAYNR